MKKIYNLLVLLPLLISPNCSTVNSYDNYKIIDDKVICNENSINPLDETSICSDVFFDEINENKDINNIFISIKEMKNNDNLEFVYIQDCINLDNNEIRLFKIFDSNIYQGYIGIDYELNVDLLYFGEYNPNLNSINKYIISPDTFGNYDQFKIVQSNYLEANDINNNINKKRIKNTIIKNKISTFSPSFPCDRADLYNFELSSFHQKSIIKETPEYFNERVPNGCGPTSGAMLISFYDRYSTLNNLVDGVLPLKHNDSKVEVDNLIFNVADYMKTDNTGTSINNAYAGLTDYIHDRGYNNYYAKAFYGSPYDTIIRCISRYHNPVYLCLKYLSENPGFASGDSSSETEKQMEYVRFDSVGGTTTAYNFHAVMAIGYSNIRYAGRYVITRFNHFDKSGEYYVKESDINPDRPIVYISK